MTSWIFRWYRKRQRQIDIDLLWPICKERASSRDIAEDAFYWHCINDRAWTKDFNQKRIADIISELD